jgi:hypothetical protein
MDPAANAQHWSIGPYVPTSPAFYPAPGWPEAHQMRQDGTAATHDAGAQYGSGGGGGGGDAMRALGGRIATLAEIIAHQSDVLRGVLDRQGRDARRERSRSRERRRSRSRSPWQHRRAPSPVRARPPSPGRQRVGTGGRHGPPRSPRSRSPRVGPHRPRDATKARDTPSASGAPPVARSWSRADAPRASSDVASSKHGVSGARTHGGNEQRIVVSVDERGTRRIATEGARDKDKGTLLCTMTPRPGCTQ